MAISRRVLDQTSAFGAFLDPVADKLMVAAALIVLVYLSRLDALIAFIIIGREITISALREWMAQIGKGKGRRFLFWEIENHVADGRDSAVAVSRQNRCEFQPAGSGNLADLSGGGTDPVVDGLLSESGDSSGVEAWLNQVEPGPCVCLS